MGAQAPEKNSRLSSNSKKIKGKGTMKPQFNMKVVLKGNEYDNLNFLSGGEKDRISIALTLTLCSRSRPHFPSRVSGFGLSC